MLPVAYRVVKGFATFFGVMGILACICGLIAGIIMHGDDKNKKSSPAELGTSRINGLQVNVPPLSEVGPQGKPSTSGQPSSLGSAERTSALGAEGFSSAGSKGSHVKNGQLGPASASLTALSTRP